MNIENWMPLFGYLCPKCHSKNVEQNMSVCLTTYPCKFPARCKDCGESFYSTDLEKQKDHGGLSPEAPIANYGWICQRCGRSLSPYVKTCDCGSYFYPNLSPYPNLTPIVYCNTASGSVENKKELNDKND